MNDMHPPSGGRNPAESALGQDAQPLNPATPKTSAAQSAAPDCSAMQRASLQRRLDLLVDGELSSADQRALFAELDQQPFDWRRCALAFLEARAWNDGAVGFVKEDRDEPPSKPFSEPNPAFPVETDVEPALTRSAADHQEQHPPQRLSIFTGPWFSIAATLLLTVLVGLEVRDRWQPGSSDAPQLASSKPPSAPPVYIPFNPHSLNPPTATLADNPLAGALTLAEPDRPPVQVPVYSSDEFDEQWAMERLTSLPDEVRRRLESMGYQVVERREWNPVVLSDGRQVMVPVNLVEIRRAPKP